jgi:uncharacterized protein (TIGR02246 family)
VALDPVAESAIRRTFARYCHSCDEGDWDRFAQLFEPDATFSVMGRTHEGRDAIRAFMEVAQGPDARGKHVLAQSDIDVDGDDATAVTDYVFITKAKAITSAGRYHDRLRRSDDGEWRIASREIRFL